MKHFFSRRVVERWNNLEQHVVDALSFKINLNKFEKLGCFLWISAINPMSLTCGLITVEAPR